MQSHQTLPNKCGESVGNEGMKFMKMFKTEQELQNHIKVSHKKESTQYNCNKCEKIFTTHTALKQHAQKAHQQLPEKCPKCPKNFKTENKLQEHINMNHIVEHAKFKCNKCDNVFTSHNALKQHAQLKHEASGRVPVGHQAWAREQNARQELIKLSCTNCSAEFRRAWS